MESPCGKLLGRYEIVAELGRGAMGAVYKARDPKIDRFVAIKTILLHQSVIHEQQEFRRRFFIEAQAAGRLLHPGIVAVFDVGEDPDTSDPYIVMEYIEGRTLRELLAGKGKKLPVDDALRITRELAEALDYAHTQGVVHRDIKPANILVTKDGQPKISDFGIAQLDLTHMTLPGRVLGTPAYMSPEQLEGEQVDGRSDLFSLGAILYTMLTGYRPFQGNSATTVCFKVANRDPLAATALAPELPHELDAVLGRALAKDPAERYQRGTEFAEHLRRLRERAPARKGTTIWFSPPVAGRTWLDGKSAPEPSSESAVALQLDRPLQAAPRRNSSPSSMFSSWQVQTAIGVPLFAAAMIVSLFAWREIRDQRAKPSPAPASQPAIRAAEQNLPSASTNIRALDSAAEGTISAEPQADQMVRASSDSQGTTAPVATVETANPSSSPSKAAQKPHRSGEVKTRATVLAKANAATLKAPASPSAAANKQTPRIAAVSAPPSAPVAAPAVADSNVEIHIENRFSDATLKIWIDDNLAYSHPLHDGHKKRLMLLGGGSKESVTMPVAAGKHTVRIEVRSASEQYDETKTVDGEFLSGGERALSITFDKHSKDMRLALGNE